MWVIKNRIRDSNLIGNDEISLDERWKFFEDLIQNEKIAKVVYGVQEALKCLLTRNIHCIIRLNKGSNCSES